MKGIFDLSLLLLLIKGKFRSRETLWTGQVTIAFFKSVTQQQTKILSETKHLK